MITSIEALNYQCLRYVKRDLEPFHILIGPNASGKSVFLDVIDFLGDLLHGGPEEAIELRANTIDELVWNHTGRCFELVVELSIPERIRNTKQNKVYTHCRYEVGIGQNENGEVSILSETFWLKEEAKLFAPPLKLFVPPLQRELFPTDPIGPETILIPQRKRTPKGWRKVVTKISESGNDWFRTEVGEWNNRFRLGPRRAALANLPEDEEKFPTAIWAKRLLMEGVQELMLNSYEMRNPCAPSSSRLYKPDGSNLPIVIRELKQKDPGRFKLWLRHIQTVLTDVQEIEVIERDEDRHLYISITYDTGLKVPSWLISDGTLRLLALTLLAYIPGENAIYLIEEPENGLHPEAVGAVFESFSSTYEAQVLVATHSPVLLSLAKPEQILCFGKTDSGATDIVSGIEHPALRNWKGEVNLSVLYASGVLG